MSFAASLKKHYFHRPVGQSNQPHLYLLLLIGVLFSLSISLDPFLSSLIPMEVWASLSLYGFPYKFSLMIFTLILTAGLIIILIQMAEDYQQIQLVILIASMQVVAIGAGGLDPIDLFAFVFLALLFATGLKDPSVRIRFPLVMYFAIALAILDLPYLATDRPAHFVIGIIKFCKSAVLPLLFVNIVQTRDHFYFMLKTMIMVAVVSSIMGIGQVIIYSLTGEALVIVDDFDEALKTTPFGMMLRAHGLNPETHTLMSFVLIALPFSLYYTIRARDNRARMGYGLSSMILVVAVFLTWSYSGIVGLAMILGLFPVFMWPNKLLHYFLGLLLIPVFLYATDMITDIINALRAEASMSTGIFQRKMLALIALDELIRNPWIGHGFDTVPTFSGNYWRRPVHDAYLEAWVALGPVGLAIFVGMLLTFTTKTFILGFAARDEMAYLSRVVSLTLICFLVVMIPEPYLYATSTWFLLSIAQTLMIQIRSDGH